MSRHRRRRRQKIQQYRGPSLEGQHQVVLRGTDAGISHSEAFRDMAVGGHVFTPGHPDAVGIRRSPSACTSSQTLPDLDEP